MKPMPNSTCKLCASGYPGLHADDCPNHVGPKAVWLPPMEACDKCAADFFATAKRERQPFDGEDHTPKRTSMFAKVKGEPCARCGDDSPKGTHPIAWPEHFKFGDHATAKHFLWAPCEARQQLHAERAARKAAPKQRRKLTLVA